MPGHSLIYITTANAAEADRIAREVVSRRLAACANIIPGMKSVYWWEGRMETGDETVLLLKTTDQRTSSLVEEIKRLHNYNVPCIVVLPLTGGNPDFLRWIETETRPL